VLCAIPTVPQRSAVVYASAIPTCPRICACSTNWTALVASCGLLRMARRLYRLGRLLKPRFRRVLSVLQRSRTWATVCRLSLHWQWKLVIPGTLRAKSKSFRPIFSVRSCTSSALCRLVSPSWSWSTFLVSIGVRLYVVRPLISARYLALYARSVYVLHHRLTVDLRG
jgi:hypothetical protein